VIDEPRFVAAVRTVDRELIVHAEEERVMPTHPLVVALGVRFLVRDEKPGVLDDALALGDGA
jgi:hypothetical protein